MTLTELIEKLVDITRKNPNVGKTTEVMLRHPGDMSFVRAKVTMTYRSERRHGTTMFDQVPCLLIEEEKDEDGQTCVE